MVLTPNAKNTMERADVKLRSDGESGDGNKLDENQGGTVKIFCSFPENRWRGKPVY